MTTPIVDLALELDLGDVNVVAMRLSEGLSRHTEATLELSSMQEVDVEPHLGARSDLVVRIAGDEQRRFALQVAGGGFTHLQEGTYRYLLHLRSPFWFLRHTLDTRKFRNLSSREIVSQVLGKHGLPHVFLLTREPDVRKYCVQYRESDLAFVERLMEYEGIFHRTDEGGRLVFADESRGSPDVPGRKLFDLVDSAGALSQAELGLQELSLDARTTSNKVSLNDFDWKRPSKRLLSSAQAGQAEHLEVYDAPGGYRRPDQGELLTRLRLEALRALRTTIEGRGNVPTFAAGHVFELGGRLGAEMSGEQLLVSVDHYFVDARYGRSRLAEGTSDGAWGAPKEGETSYANRFVAIPKGRPFRPPVQTPVPKLAGVHTAMVRGPAGEEIHTDRHGRFRAQFHWDREAVSTDDDSRWLRMLQESNSSLFLARVGWEVSVGYLHGDPDRPIGLAREINGVMAPTYAQPAQKNVMTIKTPSSPATGGYNELRLDDSAGSMSIYVQAERDMRNLVKHDHFETVGNCETHLSGSSFVRSVQRDQQVAIGANATLDVGDSHDTEVSKDRSVSIGGNESVDAGTGAGIMVTGNDTESVGSIRLTIDGSIKAPNLKANAKGLIPDAKETAKGAGKAALGALKSGGGLGGAASAAANSLKSVIPTADGVLATLTGGLSKGVTLGGLAAQLCTGTINRTADESIKRTVGGAYIQVSAASIETSASKKFLETIGGAKITLTRRSIDQSVGKAHVLTVGGALLATSGDKLGVSGKWGSTIVGGVASLDAAEKLEIIADEVYLTAAAKLKLEGPKGSMELTPGGLAFTGDVLLEPGAKLKTSGTPINMTKAGG